MRLRYKILLIVLAIIYVAGMTLLFLKTGGNTDCLDPSHTDAFKIAHNCT